MINWVTIALIAGFALFLTWLIIELRRTEKNEDS